MNHENGNFAKGMIWGVLLSIPLWLSFFGWVKMLHFIAFYFFMRGMK